MTHASMSKKVQTFDSALPFTVKTSYASSKGLVQCQTTHGAKDFRIINGRRVWMSTPPEHILPDLLQ